ncbi:MAG TPA: hypothetical protein VH088_03245 [Terriglobales bacterium]|nr:hypothetical protein [Terriglobales bacterium]
MTIPGVPVNPHWIIIDSDALIQILLTNSTAILKKLKTDYSIQCLIVQAVETELLRITSKRLHSIKSLFDKTLNSSTIRILTEELISHEKGSAIGASLFNQAEQLGRHLHRSIDRGEAFSHGAAMTLGVPVVTHDREAINKLCGDGVRFTEPLLRMYDLVGLGIQTKMLDYADCDKIRDTLLDNNEWVMQCFRNCKYVEGLPLFYARFVDASLPLIGAANAIQSLDKRLYITRTH